MKKRNKQSKSNRSITMEGSLPKLILGSNKLSFKQSTQKSWIMDIPITPQFYTQVAGAVATTTSVDRTLIPTFSTRFGSTFLEYRILGASFICTLNTGGGSSQGVIAVYLDEKAVAAPTATLTLDRPRLEIPCADTSVRAFRLDWKDSDLLDLQFTSVATTVTPVYLKVFSDVANFGNSAGGVNQLRVTGAVRLEFRTLL